MKTKWENLFCFVFEKPHIKVDESDDPENVDIMEELFGLREKELEVIMGKLKKEITNNITNLKSIERDFYLNRLLLRLKDLEDSLLCFNGIAYYISPNNPQELIEGDFRLLFGSQIKVKVEEYQVFAYFSLLKRSKEYMIDFISQIIEINNKIANASPLADISNLPQIFTSLTIEKRSILYNLLYEKGFIIKANDYESFIWIFGNNNEGKPHHFKPVVWNKNKQLLRELLMSIKNEDIKPTEVERAVPFLFTDKKGNALSLAKSKPVPSFDSDEIKKIITYLATL